MIPRPLGPKKILGSGGFSGDEALGRSRGGSGTKLPVASDALGNPVPFPVTESEAFDIAHAARLVEDFEAEHVIADQGYDSDAFVETLSQSGTEAVIPPRQDRTTPRDYDTH